MFMVWEGADGGVVGQGEGEREGGGEREKGPGWEGVTVVIGVGEPRGWLLVEWWQRRVVLVGSAFYLFF